jgi:hypothetical protein
MVDSIISNNRPLNDRTGGFGVVIQTQARMRCTGCLIADNKEAAVAGIGEAVEVSLIDTLVTGTSRGTLDFFSDGVVMSRGAALTGLRLKSTGNDGPGLHIADSGFLSDGPPSTCEDCLFEGNGFAGVVLRAGSLQLSNSTIRGNLANSTAGGGVGLYAYQDSDDTLETRALLLENTVVTEHEYASIWLQSEGQYTIEGSTLQGGEGSDIGGGFLVHGNAVYATDIAEAGALSISGSLVSNARDVAILLDGSTAELDDISWVDNGIDLVQQDCDGVDALTEVGGAEQSELCTGSNRLVVELDFATYYREIEAREE